MTVREIALQAGVSPATVSRYFTGAENVSKAVAERIDAVLKAAGSERINQAKRKSGVLVLAVPHMRLAFYSELMKCFLERIQLRRMQIVFLPISGIDAAQFRAMLARLRPDGLILFEETSCIPIFDIAEEFNIPVAVCGEALPQPRKAVTLHVNDIAAAYEGTRYLLELGHRNIVFFSNYAHGVNASYQRLSGCSRAMEENGLTFGGNYVRFGELIYENGYRFAQEIVTSGLPFSAIFAFSDEMAQGAIYGLQDLHVRVPQDVSVLGFDDLPLSVETRPKLTTIHQPLDTLVQSTIDIFFNDNYSMCSEEILMPYYIVKRDSCASRETRTEER